jgi:hypothetical protein
MRSVLVLGIFKDLVRSVSLIEEAVEAMHIIFISRYLLRLSLIR